MVPHKGHVQPGGFPTYGDLIVITKNGRPVWIAVSRERFLKAFVAKRRPEAAFAEQSIAEKKKQYEAFVAPEATSARQAEAKAAIDKMASQGAAAVEHERRYWERQEAETLATLKRGAFPEPKGMSAAAIVAGLKTAEEQLATMSAAERAEPASLLANRDDATTSGLVPMGTPTCTPLVAQNPDFFDSSLSRSVPQIVIAWDFRRLEETWKSGRPPVSKPADLALWTTWEAFRQTDLKKLADLLDK